MSEQRYKLALKLACRTLSAYYKTHADWSTVEEIIEEFMVKAKESEQSSWLEFLNSIAKKRSKTVLFTRLMMSHERMMKARWNAPVIDFYLKSVGI